MEKIYKVAGFKCSCCGQEVDKLYYWALQAKVYDLETDKPSKEIQDECNIDDIEEVREKAFCQNCMEDIADFLKSFGMKDKPVDQTRAKDLTVTQKYRIAVDALCDIMVNEEGTAWKVPMPVETKRKGTVNEFVIVDKKKFCNLCNTPGWNVEKLTAEFHLADKKQVLEIKKQAKKEGLI